MDERIADRTPDTFIVVEHPHVFTLGRRGNRANLLSNELPVYQVERGGDVTYHGPGQLIGYPILKLLGPEQDVHSYLSRVEELLIRTVAEFGIRASRSQRQTGVWVEAQKLASIGVAIKSWVTYHGFALNVNTNLSFFQKIRPCGLEPSTITSMQQILGRSVDMDEVKSAVKSHFKDVFQRGLQPTYGERTTAISQYSPSPQDTHA